MITVRSRVRVRVSNVGLVVVSIALANFMSEDRRPQTMTLVLSTHVCLVLPYTFHSRIDHLAQ